MKKQCVLHDQANLCLLPVLGAMAILGICGYVDPVTVTQAFAWYIVADFAWILFWPDAIPSLPSIILFHHAVTFVLVCFPLRHPQLALFTCWDGLVEINTLFLIMRRQLRWGRPLYSFLYWATFLPLRMVLFPCLLVKFYHVMKPYPWWETAVALSCQLILCAFNYVLLALSVMNWRKRSKRPRSSGSDAKVSASVLVTAGAVGSKSAGGLQRQGTLNLQAKVM